MAQANAPFQQRVSQRDWVESLFLSPEENRASLGQTLLPKAGTPLVPPGLHGTLPGSRTQDRLMATETPVEELLPPFDSFSGGGAFLTFEEAAAHLGWSDALLFRLCHMFQLPASEFGPDASNPPGVLPVRESLLFHEDELGFFRQVRERLLAGETLAHIRQTLPSPQFVQQTHVVVAEALSEGASPEDFPSRTVSQARSSQASRAIANQAVVNQATVTQEKSTAATGTTDRMARFAAQTADTTSPSLPRHSRPRSPLQAAGLQTPFERAAQQTFQRYKAQRRPISFFKDLLNHLRPSVEATFDQAPPELAVTKQGFPILLARRSGFAQGGLSQRDLTHRSLTQGFSNLWGAFPVEASLFSGQSSKPESELNSPSLRQWAGSLRQTVLAAKHRIF
ncbi:MAG: hypothetical protein SFZ03_02065 [Candidatus Melainabacteria bacterium]|nr:hypothetical protein [Candidatus Melainabacteria bacterium]